MVFYNVSFDHIDDVFGYIGGVITNSLKMMGNKKEWDGTCNGG